MSVKGNGRVVVITGASAGIGAATARALADAGFRLALGARRQDKLTKLADEIETKTGVRPFTADLDVTVAESAEAFVAEVLKTYEQVHVLLNNAGLARGSANIAEAQSDAEWQQMLDTNVSGLLRMTRILLPHIIKSGDGHVVNMGSIAGRETYAGGAVYCATKFAVRAITDALRQELLGQPVRVSTVDPGMVETEFSVVRYGDQARADEVYTGMTPLTAEDIADCILFAVTRPRHVNIDAIIIKPTDQAGAGKVARR